MDRVVDRGEAHRSHAGQNGHATAFGDLHLVHVRAGRDVVIGVHRPDYARERFGERTGVKAFARIVEQATLFHHFVGDYHVGGVAADITVRIARGAQYADRPFFVIECGLDRKFSSGSEFLFPLGAHFDDLTGELVADDDRILGDVARNAFVDVRLVGGFVGGHANTVAHYFREDLILFDLRQLELLQPEVVLAI